MRKLLVLNSETRNFEGRESDGDINAQSRLIFIIFGTVGVRGSSEWGKKPAPNSTHKTYRKNGRGDDQSTPPLVLP